MDILVDRKHFTEKSTISEVYVDGIFTCYILEDCVRERPGSAVGVWKIPHETAIPQGRYKVARTMSPRFGKLLPLLLNVPGYEGVRIHPGNTDKDTDGCLLPGMHMAEDAVSESRAAFAKLDGLIENALDDGEAVWITVQGVPE